MTTLSLKEETTEAIRESKLPSWITFIGSVIITALLTGILSSYASQSGQDAKIEQNTKAVSDLYQTKVNKEEVDKMDRRLDRMEDKLDRIIENQQIRKQQDAKQ